MKYEACPHCRQSHESTACNTSATSLIVTASSTTSTKTPRERLHDLIKQNYNENTARCVVALAMPLLEEARQEMKSKCIKALGEIQPEFFGDEYTKQKNVFIEEATKSISSL